MRPRATSWRSRKRSAVCTEVTARSVSAAVTCITGQTPPMSHSAINSAASDFMRRSSCITSASRGGRSTSREVFSISAARCGSGSHAQQTDQPRGIGADQVEQVGRELGDAEQDGPGDAAESSSAPISADCCGLEFGEPVCQALFGLVGRGDMRPVHEPRGQGAYCHS